MCVGTHWQLNIFSICVLVTHDGVSKWSEVVEAGVDSSDDHIDIDEDESTLSLIECKQGVEDLIKSMLNLLQSDSFSNIQEQTDTRL